MATIGFHVSHEQIVSKEDAANIDPNDYLAALRSFINRRNGSAILLGEVNLPYTELGLPLPRLSWDGARR